jgi:hypothetical protein
MLLVPLALACGSKEPPNAVADMRGGINEIVIDPARAARMQAVLDKIEAAVVAADSLYEEERVALEAMVRNYGSSREEIEQSLLGFNALHESYARRFFAAHASLKAEATAEEWKELREFEMSVIQSAATRATEETAPAENEE